MLRRVRRWHGILAALALVWAGAAGVARAQGSLYLQALARLQAYRIVQGDDQGGLRAGSLVTRAEVAKMAAVAAGLEGRARALAATPGGAQGATPAAAPGAAVAFAPFRDLAGHWAAGYVAAAREAGLVSGYQDGTFRPDTPMTYGEALTVLARAAGLVPAPDRPWPQNYLEAAARSGLLPPELPLTTHLGTLAVRGPVLVLADALFSGVRDPAGHNLYQRVHDPDPPRLFLTGPVPLQTTAATALLTGRLAGASAAWLGDQPLPLAPDGTFRAEVSLAPGDNAVTIRAVDLAGNTAAWTRHILRKG